jgi:hypothetical protein
MGSALLHPVSMIPVSTTSTSASAVKIRERFILRVNLSSF